MLRCTYLRSMLPQCRPACMHASCQSQPLGTCRDRKLFVLDTATGNIVTTATLECDKRCSAMAWGPQQPGAAAYTLATAADSDVSLWTIDPYKGWMRADRVAPGNVRRQISALAFSADGQWLFAGQWSQCRLPLSDAPPMHQRATYPAPSVWKLCSCRALSAAGTASGDVVSINVQRMVVQTLHPVCTGAVGALLLGPGGQLLVGGADGSITHYSFPVSSTYTACMAALFCTAWSLCVVLAPTPV